MGTNYYLVEQEEKCPHCGRADEGKRLHIGKSSAGWVFALHVIPEEGLNCLLDWERKFQEPGWKILDEYGRETEAVWLQTLIAGKAAAGKRERSSWCLGNDGTCDLLPGVFS
jgi:hypothetical protein